MAESQLPQRDEDVVAYSAFNGLRNDVTPERFDAGDLDSAINVDIDKSGRISRRDGYTSKLAGASHSIWSDDLQDVCLFVQAGQLQLMNQNLTATPLRTLVAPDSRMGYWRVNDRVYFGNGSDNGIYERGVVRSWGLPVPPLPGAALGVGNLAAGTYQFTLTWLRKDGQESGAPLAGALVVPADGGAVVLTLPVSSHPDVVGVVVYMTTANGKVLYDAAHLANGTTSVTLADEPQNGLDLVTQFLQAPPAGQLCAFYRSRMFVAVGDTLFWSHPHAPELFDLREYLQLDGAITMLAPMYDKDRQDSGRDSGFFVSTDRGVGILAGSEPREFQFVPKTDYPALPGALDYVDGSLFRDGDAGARQLPVFLTTQGLCVGLPELVVNNLTRTKFSFPAGGRGAALFMPGPNRFVATANL